MEQLKAYLSGRPKGAFAAEVGIVPAYLSQILGGVRQPSFALAMRIEAASGGEVPVTVWPQFAVLNDRGAA